MGDKVQRLVPTYAFYSQDYSTEKVTIRVYFRCKELFTPYGLEDSLSLTVGGIEQAVDISQDNTTVYVSFTPDEDMDRTKV